MLTFMAVHAHPDDEASSTGGVLAKYAAEGIRTVVVTCTNGELGDLPGGIKPDAEGHDEREVVRIRRAELERACELLNVSHLEMLGYRDSGMVDWEHKGHADAFCNVPLDAAVDRLGEVYERYRPDVVVSYSIDSAYNHPDHVQAAKVMLEASKRTGIPKKVYFIAMRGNRWVRIREMLEQEGVELPPPPPRNEEWEAKQRELEARVTTAIDVSDFALQKVEALRTHASQIDGSFWSKLPPHALAEIFGEECFILDGGPKPAEGYETDLFAGLR